MAIQAALNKSEQWLRVLLAHSSDAIVLTSADGHLLYASPSIERILGYSPEEYRTRTGAQLIHPEDLEEAIALFRHLLQQPDVTLPPHQTRFRHQDGSWRWIEYSATNLLTDPAVGALVFNMRDITERKHTEQAQHLLAAIVASSDDAIVSKTLQGIITSWNAGAEKLFGYSAQEAIGHHITLIVPPEFHQQEDAIMQQLRAGQCIDHFETSRLRKDGTTVAVSLSISPVKDSRGRIFGAATIARDMTERVQAERRKDEFIGMASHELRTPLTTLKGFTYVLQRHLSQLGDEQGLAYLAKMDRQLTKLTTLISELLDLSRMQSGSLSFQQEAFDLLALVEESVESLQQTTQAHHLWLAEAQPVQVVGDRDRIGQVLMNLVSNAIKYSPQADQVMVRVMREHNQAVVSVQDFGIGIAQHYHDKIFERFYQVTEPEVRTYPGLGIGLYISREIISRHGGRIWVESSPGQGATFYMSLPLPPAGKATGA